MPPKRKDRDAVAGGRKKKPRASNVGGILALATDVGQSVPSTVAKRDEFTFMYSQQVKKKIQHEIFFYHGRWFTELSDGNSNSKRVPPVKLQLYELMRKTGSNSLFQTMNIGGVLTKFMDNPVIKDGIVAEVLEEVKVVARLRRGEPVSVLQHVFYGSTVRYYSPTLMVFLENKLKGIEKYKDLLTNRVFKSFMHTLLRIAYFEMSEFCRDDGEDFSVQDFKEAYTRFITPVFRLVHVFFSDPEIKSLALSMDRSGLFTLDSNLIQTVTDLMKSDNKLKEDFKLPYNENYFRTYFQEKDNISFISFYGSQRNKSHKELLPSFDFMEQARRQKQARQRITGIVSPVKIQEVSLLSSVHEFVQRVFRGVEHWDDLTENSVPTVEKEYRDWLGSVLCLLQVAVGSRSNGIYGVNEIDPVYVKPYSDQVDEEEDPDEQPQKLQELYTADYPAHLITVRRLTKEKNKAAREVYEYFSSVRLKNKDDFNTLEEVAKDLDDDDKEEEEEEEEEEELLSEEALKKLTVKGQKNPNLRDVYRKENPDLPSNPSESTFGFQNKTQWIETILRLRAERKGQNPVPEVRNVDMEQAVERAEDASLLRRVTKPLQHYFFNPLEMVFTGETMKDKMEKLKTAENDSVSNISRAIFFRLFQLARDEIKNLSVSNFGMKDTDWRENKNEEASEQLRHKVDGRSVYAHWAVKPEVQYSKNFRRLCMFLRGLCAPLITDAFKHLKGVSRATHELRRLYVCYAYYIFGSQNMKEIAFASRVLGHKHLDTSSLYTSLQIVPTIGPSDRKFDKEDSQKLSVWLMQKVDAYLEECREKKEMEDDEDSVEDDELSVNHVSFSTVSGDIVVVEKLKSERGLKDGQKDTAFYVNRCFLKMVELQEKGIEPTRSKMRRLGEVRKEVLNAAFERFNEE